MPLRSIETVERVEEDGKTYLKALGVLAKEGVYQYPRANRDRPYQEYLPGEALETSVEAWEQIPIILDHPVDEVGIATVLDVGTEDPPQIGEIREPIVDTDGEATLTGEIWFDLSHSGKHDGHFDAIVEALENDEMVETSAAYRTNRANESGIYNGEHYEAVQRPLLPDHVAVFSPESGKTGNCSVEAGCGIGRANEDRGIPPEGSDYVTDVSDVDDDTAASIGRRVLDAIGLGGLFDRANEAHSDGDEAAESAVGTDGGTSPSHDSETMKDQDKIDYLVEEHGLDRANMEPLAGTNCLGQIYERYEATANVDESGDAGDGDAGNSGTDGVSGDGADDDSDSSADDSALDQIMARLDELEEANEQLREQVTEPLRAQQEAAAEQLAEEIGVEADAISVDADVADTILARANEASGGDYSYEVEQNQRLRANMAGVAGKVTRSNVDDTEAYVAGVQQGNDRFQSGGD